MLATLPRQQSFGLAQDQLFLIGCLVHLSHLRQQEGGDLCNRCRHDVKVGQDNNTESV